MRIAVTGAMGTGKSTLVKWLAEHLPGYEFFNVDTLVAQLYDDPFFVADLMKRFGVADRKVVSKIVFEDPEARLWLEDLASGLLSAKLGEISAKPRIVVEFPLLFEMAAPYAQFDIVVATWCPSDIQRERIHLRDSRDPEHTERMLAAQFDVDVKAQLADVVVDMTEGPDESLVPAIEAAFEQERLKERSANFFGTDAVWPVISALYSSPDREAHNLAYLARRLAAFDEHKHLAVDPRALELAIWFHSAAQSVTAAHYMDTPASSAKLMWRVLAQTAPQWLTYRDTVPLATEFILAQHSLDVTSARLLAKPTWAADAALFLDLAMMEYALPKDELQTFWLSTKREMSEIHTRIFESPFVLQGLLSREKLLHTPALHETHETAVREGIEYLVSLYPSSSDDGDDFDGGPEGFEGPGEGPEPADPSMQFNTELHALQDRIFAGEDVFKDDKNDKEAKADDEHKVDLPPWPAHKRNTPYHLD